MVKKCKRLYDGHFCYTSGHFKTWSKKLLVYYNDKEARWLNNANVCMTGTFAIYLVILKLDQKNF